MITRSASGSNYPYFDSGVVIVSGIEQGLFVLRPQGTAAPVPAGTGPGTLAPNAEAARSKPTRVGKRVRVNRKRRARVVVKCPAQKPDATRTIVNEDATCVGRFAIKTRGKRIARKRFEVPAARRRSSASASGGARR